MLLNGAEDRRGRHVRDCIKTRPGWVAFTDGAADAQECSGRGCPPVDVNALRVTRYGWHPSLAGQALA